MSRNRKCQAEGGSAHCTNPRCPEKLSGFAAFFAKPDAVPVARTGSYEEPVVGSKHVRRATAERYEIAILPTTDIARAELELRTYADAIGYPDAVIKTGTKNGRRTIWFDAVNSLSGTDYNTQVYPNITWVEDLMRERDV